MTPPKTYGVIIQARNNSRRLFGKMTMPFYDGKTILELLLTKIISRLGHLQIIVATTDKSVDNSIVEMAKRYGVQVFEGDENNVLKRMLDAASQYKVDNIIRVCADNPFLNIESISELITHHKEKPTDYVSFLVGDKKPSILSHFGFFAELVMKSSLEKVANRTKDDLYLEHVTNYIYTNPKEFDLFYLRAPSYLYNREDIRLTVDTILDFELAQSLYSSLIKNNWNQRELIKYIDSNSGIKKSMNRMINQNRK